MDSCALEYDISQGREFLKLKIGLPEVGPQLFAFVRRKARERLRHQPLLGPLKRRHTSQSVPGAYYTSHYEIDQNYMAA